MNRFPEDAFSQALIVFIHATKNRGERKNFIFASNEFYVLARKDVQLIDYSAVEVFVVENIAWFNPNLSYIFGSALGIIDKYNPWYATICNNVQDSGEQEFLKLVGYKKTINRDSYRKLMPEKNKVFDNSSNRNYSSDAQG